MLSGLSGLDYSTYFSPNLGSWDDIGWDVTLDGSGNAYVVGETAVCDYCGPPFPPPFSPGDVFVAKFDTSGALAWSSKLGGTGDDAGYGIAVDDSGGVYVTGQTGSADFPITAGAFRTTLSGSQDAFVTKLDGGNGALLYSTYLGGGGSELPWSLALDSAGHVYVTGTTGSADFPTTAGAFQTALSGASDAFVVELNLNAANPADQLVYASYLGGSGDDTGVEIVVDAAGKVYVAGETTSSSDFPTQNGFQANYGGGSYDGFLTRLDPTGTGLEYSTYFGGSGYDGGWGVVVDAFGNAFMTGPTDSADFPTTAGAFQETSGGLQDAYVTKIDTTQAGAASAIYSTYLGGSDSEDGNEIALAGNEVVVVGNTRSTDFPTQNAYQASLNVWYDAFVTRLNASGSAVVDSTYLGGSKVDWAWGIALDGAGDVYITGETHSETDFPTQNAHQSNFGGGSGDAFLTKFTGAGAPPPPPPPPPSTTKFYVVDSDVDDTFEYDDIGALLNNTNLAAGNVDPVGTTASADGATVWVVDKNQTVYVYDGDGNLQGSWTAGGLNRASGIATDETDLWIVDERNDRVYRYNGAATRLSGSAGPSDSFALDGANGKAKGITTDGTSIWVVNDGKNSDEVFKYNTSGMLLGSWTIDSANAKPSGVALDGSDVWIVDRGNGSVFQYVAAAGVTSGSQAAAASFTLDVNNSRAEGIVTVATGPVNQPPAAIADAYGVAEDANLNVAAPGVLANDTDAESDPLTAVLLSGAGNGAVTLNADGSFAYTPDADFNGTDSFTYKANDGTSDSNVASVSITVNPVNDAPVADNQSVAAKQNSAKPITLSAGDVDGDALTYSVLSGPSHGALGGAAPNLTYTPSTGYTGPDTFTFKANDGAVDSNVATVSIIVAANNPPAADPQSVSVAEDGLLPITLTGTDPDGDPITYIVVSGPADGSLTGTAPNLTYTPAANFNGPDSFTFKVNDGTDDSPFATVSITATPVNDAPVANNDSLTTEEDTAVGITLNGSDIDGDALSFHVTAGPANGTLSGTAPNLTYTPNADFNGSDSFTFVANDGTVDSGTATVSITVHSVNDAPAAAADSYSTDQDTTLAIPAPGVLSNDSDVDGDPLTAVLATGPSNGTLTLNADGSFSYAPSAGFLGSDSFTYQTNDGIVNSNIATVTITVNPVSGTKFFVVDKDVDDTFEYDAGGNPLPGDTWNLAAGNTDPKGATANVAGNRVWVIDKNRTVYVYDGDGASLGSWTAGGLNRPDGIATDETDIWIVDKRNNRVYRYANAAARTSGSQNATSSFSLDGGNRKAKGITTDGTSIWVVNDGKTTDKVFKYNLSGTLLGRWTIDSVNAKPGGITIDPSGSSQSIWIVDRDNATVFEYANARGNSGGSLSGSFSLASGNTSPEGIADPLIAPSDLRDTNDDGSIMAMVGSLVLNRLSGSRSDSGSTNPLDVNGDGYRSPLEALPAINHVPLPRPPLDAFARASSTNHHLRALDHIFAAMEDDDEDGLLDEELLTLLL